MYKIGVVLASGEQIAYPWISLDAIGKKNKETYEFIVFQQEQYDRLFAEMRLGALDGVVFSSNVSNDERIRNLILANRDIVSQFVKRGKGVLILLQYHLARKGRSFDIIDKNVFNDEVSQNNADKNLSDDKSLFDVEFIKDEGDDEEREQNTVVLTNGIFDEKKVVWNKDSILLSYPNQITCEDIYKQSQNSRFVKSFAPAHISRYEHAYFSAPFCLKSNDHQQSKPLLIYSSNDERRVVITTLAADLQEHNLLLENMISYIARGRPEAVLWKDSSCSYCTGCPTEEYLTRAKIHYFVTNEQQIECEYDRMNINRSKYVVMCGETAYSSYKKISEKGIALPVKTSLYSISNLSTGAEEFQKKIIVDVPAVSQIELWAMQGYNYLIERFPRNERINNKWDTLYATEQVVTFVSEIKQAIPEFIREQIQKYLSEHNQDKKTFDKVEKSTQAAKKIYSRLEEYYLNEDPSNKDSWNKYSLNFECGEPQRDIVTDEEKKIDASKATLFDLARLVLRVNNPHELEHIDDIIARFVTERDFRKAAWEDDVMTTACVLRALRKIEKHNIKTSLTNIICSCYNSVNDLELTVSLSKSVERARQSEYNMLCEKIEFEKKLKESEERNTETDKLTEMIESLKNRLLRRTAWLATFVGICALSVLMFIAYVIEAKDMNQDKYIEEVKEFLMSWGIGEAVLGIASIIVTIILFRVLYNSEIRKALSKGKAGKNKKEDKGKNKEKKAKEDNKNSTQENLKSGKETQSKAKVKKNDEDNRNNTQ